MASLLVLTIFFIFLSQTDIKSIHSQPNMRYVETSGKVYSKKSDYMNVIVRACARKLENSFFFFYNIFTSAFYASFVLYLKSWLSKDSILCIFYKYLYVEIINKLSYVQPTFGWISIQPTNKVFKPLIFHVRKFDKSNVSLTQTPLKVYFLAEWRLCSMYLKLILVKVE